MNRAHPHHVTAIETASASIAGVLILMLTAILAMLHDCSEVLTDIPHVHH
jgi:hypothetical protein